MRLSTQPLAVVLDTNVWLDILVFDDPRCTELSRALQDNRCVALMSNACEEELRFVAARAHLRDRKADLDWRLKDTLARVRHIDPHVPPHVPRCRDASDQKFIELAVGGNAVALISKDRAVLKLARKLAPLMVMAPGGVLDDLLVL
ncbi:MAG TPA: putative toxin-antitoxin system toxin component, PIN family [Burkholderiaceae bacterium]|nr:putative toxin-antitoxin system toxin component, PIN family [Burkholderiaceae bacterium]